MLKLKLSETNHLQISEPLSTLNTTHIMGFHEKAARLNCQICNALPLLSDSLQLGNNNLQVLLSTATDYVDGSQHPLEETSRMFKSKTNLPDFVQLQPGARVMALNNRLFSKEICNGTIGIVQSIETMESVRIVFPVLNSIVDVNLGHTTSHFNLNGARACRQQFPLQNAYALTVHKTQGITLSHVSVALDEQIFTRGQAYTSLSRVPSWSSLSITALSHNAFQVDSEMITEYECLHKVAGIGLSL